MPSRVAIVKGPDRGENIRRALDLIADQIKLGERIMVKPILVSGSKTLAVTHPEALDAVLQFLRERTDREITVAEGAAIADTMQCFEKFGLAAVARRYGARLVDLNRDKWVGVEVLDRDLKVMRLRFARTVAESDCRISLAPMKTHDAASSRCP